MLRIPESAERLAQTSLLDCLKMDDTGNQYRLLPLWWWSSWDQSLLAAVNEHQ